MLAERHRVSPAAVSEGVRRLADRGLVLHAPYGAIALTESGRMAALGMVRRHRLIETLLVQELGYSWDEVHDEAEVLEHAVSDTLVDRIDARLGCPRRDPHGDRIPSATGELAAPSARSLSAVPVGSRAQVLRVSDADPEMLRYFATVGLQVDGYVTVVERRRYAGVLRCSTSVADDIDLGSDATRSIWVSLD
jgi:DtxR family Mn-dependent transcriptional regulator